ncbi:ABC transporter ATP-binding protein [Mangrovimonas aestuarii]|uniref:ABC transporter ATP-binding protein n=1 Tax=Mangrovimonas aestuarii TaxID=3018443 RepID=UPI002377F0A6|nr:ABC transporter ATP-binding protein [Mangrovimonas aestuarii]
MNTSPILKIENLAVAFNKHTVLHNISYTLNSNEILGIVGESGSGKSVSSLAVLGLLPNKVSSIESGSIQFHDSDLTSLTNKDFQNIRGNKISMIFQEPMSSLNPSMRCGKQVEEILKQHTKLNKQERKEETLSLFEKVKLPDPKRVYKSYPHEISGGQKQRVMIAMAIACKPEILIADEPTTALDVTVQKEIISLLKSLQQETKMSIIFISHDLSLISDIADNVAVMYQGNIVEQGSVTEIFRNPKHTYTKALIHSRPTLGKRLKKLPTIQDYLENNILEEEVTSEQRQEFHKKLYSKEPLLEIKNLEKEYFSRSGWFSKPESFKAVNQVSFKLYEGETLGLVGESGCGKSTLSNTILQLDKATAGKIYYKGKDITHISPKALKALRKDIQIIFQDPFASLNPRLTVGQAIMEPMLVHNLYNSKKEREKKTIELLKQVGLSEEHFNRYPHEFSGGQRQRIGIARTIALQPKLIVCDESVSALDISVQAQVLNLLNTLKEDFGFTYIFISHDLAVVKYMADQLIVMHDGKIAEKGDADEVYDSPKTDYTKTLIEAIPKGL